MSDASVVITGGCGFLGTALARKIAAEGIRLPVGQHLANPALHLLDIPTAKPPSDINTTFHPIDIADKDAISAVLPDNTVLIYHLAAVVSGQVEADPDLGMRVNLQGTDAILRAARDIGPIPVIGTSSLAVYGQSVATPLTEATATQPTNTYGVSKAMAELLMADHRRRGWSDARTLRLPTVTVRPGKPNAAASSFVSSIIREPLAGSPANCPVPPDTALWVGSPRSAVNALHHAASVATKNWPLFGAVNAPGLTITVAQMLARLKTHDPIAAARISHEPDATITKIVGGWPSEFDCALATSLGFQGDQTFEDIFAQAVTSSE